MNWAGLAFAIALGATACAGNHDSDGASGDMTELVYDLPHSQGQGFASLDEYLAHLHRLGAQDRPYYEEISPGQYRRMAGRRPPGASGDEHIYTRAELLAEFGFNE